MNIAKVAFALTNGRGGNHRRSSPTISISTAQYEATATGPRLIVHAARLATAVVNSVRSGITLAANCAPCPRTLSHPRTWKYTCRSHQQIGAVDANPRDLPRARRRGPDRYPPHCQADHGRNRARNCPVHARYRMD